MVLQVIYMAGWSPDVSQQRPKRRGSATVSFDDLHKAFTPDGDTKKSPDDGSGGNLKQEVPTESNEEPTTGDRKPEGDGTTRLPSGTWYKIE